MLLPAFIKTGAQVSCFARTEFDTRSVYAQQPFKLTFTVLTATWYTAPLEFENLQMPNAFIIPFDQTRPGMFDVNGKQYAGLQFYFIVFPYKPGNYTVPPIKIVATTPPEGQSESKKVTIATTPQQFVVKPMPSNYSGDWFVAKDVIVTQQWNKPLRNLKIGDVIERTVIENAKGTLPQFIPELKTDSLNWASVYPQDASLQDTRDDYDANGVRTQTFTYLLEKEGDFILPAAVVKWWNPYSKKVFQRSAGAIKIHVAANPNLGILATIKDSLTAKQPVITAEKKRTGPYLIYGIPWYWFTLYALAVLLALYIVVRSCIRMYRSLHRRYINYTNSEIYWFREFDHASLQFPELLKKLYAWWDRFKIPGKSSSIIADSRRKNEDSIARPLSGFYEEAYEKDDRAVKVNPEFKKQVKLYRNSMHKNGEPVDDDRISRQQQLW
ncbi:MAG TPA: BatD family protein [Parafilimonas sp.]|nr:BatD family protein [Parafilimonas sp.]